MWWMVDRGEAGKGVTRSSRRRRVVWSCRGVSRGGGRAKLVPVSFKLHLRCRDEAKGPVTAVCGIDGYLVSSMGQKIFVRAFDLDEQRDFFTA